MTDRTAEVIRYGINGVIATAVHYGVLTLNLTVLEFQYAGMANFLAAAVGIACSFLGSRYFVFRAHSDSAVPQGFKFLLLYGCIAIVHGIFLLLWTDFYGLDYRAGFVVATFIQVASSYIGNKTWVFQ